MGVGAAIIFPTTLSIISVVFTDRTERANAIGLWGAVTGLAIALDPTRTTDAVTTLAINRARTSGPCVSGLPALSRSLSPSRRSRS